MYNPHEDPNIKLLLDRIVPAVNPIAVYLFGSRARGEARENSDYDLFLLVDDDTPREKLQPQALYPTVRDVAVAADIIPCFQSIFHRYQNRAGTLSAAVHREGVHLYERA